MADAHDLQRFVDAQNANATYDRALAELRAGRKVSHWMWFVFPQIAGLGRSHMAQTYAVSGLDEARAYLAHAVLGPRLTRVASVLAEHEPPDAEAILGAVDAQKLVSCMTLFARADPDNDVFRTVLERYFEGREDAATVTRL